MAAKIAQIAQIAEIAEIAPAVGIAASSPAPAAAGSGKLFKNTPYSVRTASSHNALRAKWNVAILRLWNSPEIAARPDADAKMQELVAALEALIVLTERLK